MRRKAYKQFFKAKDFLLQESELNGGNRLEKLMKLFEIFSAGDENQSRNSRGLLNRGSWQGYGAISEDLNL